MTKKVSVIIPVYNAEKYLPETLRCLLEQDYPDYEVLAVNDCSTDGSTGIINEFAERFREKNTDLILVDRLVNGGLCAAINSGIGRAKGSYLCFPDADDEIAPDYISSMMKILEKEPSKKWVRCDYTIVLEEEGREYDVHLPSKSVYKNDYFDFVSKFIPHNAWNMIVEREYFEQCIGSRIYDSRLTQEWSLLIPLSYHSDYARCGKLLYRYHIRKNAMSSWQNKDIESVIEHFDALEQLNLIMTDSLDCDDEEFLAVSKRALKIYYHLMKYKKYAQKSYDEQADRELEELYAVSYDLTYGEFAARINEPDLYVRVVFDKLLGADTGSAEMRYDEYKELFKSVFVVLYDKPGKKLMTALTAAYGEPVKIIYHSDYDAAQWSSAVKVCLIENSQIYKDIVDRDFGSAERYFDYRDIRESLRGWAAREVVM